jgi:putative ABC transport system permease protein
MSTRRRPGDDFDREIRVHIELETERLIREGVAADEARAAARKTFGNVTRVRERFYEAGRLLWLDHLRQDLRCAARSIRRYPVAALVAIISLAGGIGATTVTLTIRDIIFRKAPPLYREPGQLSRVQVGTPDRPIMPIGSAVPASLFYSWRDAFGRDVAAASAARPREARTEDRTETVPVRAVTPEFFTVLGVAPALGGLPSASPGAGVPPAAVLSHRAWERLFDARADALGRVVWIDNQPYTVAGVLPPRFWFSEMNSPIWTVLDRQAVPPDEGLDVIVRRPPGITPAFLDGQLQTGLADYTRQRPAAERQQRLKVSGIEGTPIGNQMAFILPYVLGMSVALTLLIACANVAVLMIAQWTAREHEIAIRASIGASRGRIVRALLTESTLVATCGGALGVGATIALMQWARHGIGDAMFFDLSIDSLVFVQSAAITLLTGIVAGVAPALYETRRLHTNPLRSLAASDRVRQRWRHALVVMEITITVALLVETGALVDGYRRTQHADMGFAPAPLMVATVETPGGVPAGPVLDILRHLPGVAAAAGATAVPYAGGGREEQVATDAGVTNAIAASRSLVTADFFSTLGVAIRAGRPFSTTDSAATRAAIVNETLSKQLGVTVGRQIWIGQKAYDVVGIVTDYASNPMQTRMARPKVFLPLAVDARGPVRVLFLIRAEGDPAPLVQAVRRESRKAAAGTVVLSAYTFDQTIAVMGQEMLIGTAPLVPLIAIGTLLTAAGIYGVLAFALARRSRELAVRMAIGASPRDVVRLVASQTVRLVLTGSATGIGVTFALSRVVRAAGGGGSLFDPEVHVFVWPVLAIIVIGAVATWVPSRRALKINPAVLLRTT